MSEKIEKSNAAVETATNTGVGTYVFKKPTTIDGEEVKEINYDFNVINGAAIRDIRTELGKRAYAASVPEIDQVFQAGMFAVACGLTLDNVEAFALRDYFNVTELARDFLLAEE